MSCAEPADSRRLERAAMVEQQLRRRGIHDPRVLAAMNEIPRECFVPEEMRSAAYGDHALSIGAGQTISQPYMVARACELAELGPDDTALEVGGGSGYQAAVLARLCRQVVSLELIDTLALTARTVLQALHIENVIMLDADGTLGFPPRAPYDAIVVAAGAPEIPAPLIDQLATDGRLVIPIGDDHLQTLKVIRRRADGLDHREYDGCVYVPLRGAGGWADRKR